MLSTHININHCPSKTNTLSGDDEAGYAVRDTGASCQEGDAHNDLRDSKCVADYGHLDGDTETHVCTCVFAKVRVCEHVVSYHPDH